MNVDTLLKDTFAAREHLATDADEVMAAVHERIANRHSVTGPLAIAASVVVMAGAASGAVVLNHHDSHPAHRQVQQAAGPGQAAPSVRSGIAPLTMPFDLGWLPEGSASYHVHRINVGGTSDTSPPVFDGEYMLTVATPTGPVDIDVQQIPGDLTGIKFKSGAGQPVTIGGRDGIESSNSGGPGGYEVYFRDAAGGVIYVNVLPEAGRTAPVDQLVTIGRRVAGNVGFPGTAQVNPTFGLGYLPAGMQMRTFDVEDGMSALLNIKGAGGPVTSYQIGTATGLHAAATVSTSIGAPSGTPGRAVQGHPTRYTDENGYRSLYVLNAVNGKSVMVAGPLALAELYKIADGLVLPS